MDHSGVKGWHWDDSGHHHAFTQGTRGMIVFPWTRRNIAPDRLELPEESPILVSLRGVL